MREQTTALDKKAGCRRKKQNPPRIGSFGDQNASPFQFGVARIRDHTNRPAYNPRTATDPLALLAARFHCCASVPKRIPLIDDAPGFKAVIGRLALAIGCKLAFSRGSKRLQIDRSRSSLNEAENFLDFQIENIPGLIQQIDRVQALADLDEDPAHAAEESGAFEAQIFAL